MIDGTSTVIVVDDDISIREALQGLLQSVGLFVSVYGSVQEYRAAPPPEGLSCLILDIRLPGQSGLGLQEELAKAKVRTPVIFITGHGDIPMSVRAMKAGAVEFRVKPFRDEDLLDAVRAALERDRDRRREDEIVNQLRQKFDTLSPREKEVMDLVAAGQLNKQVADTLKISEITVKVHRGQAMRKMAARSLAELVRMADRLRAAGGAFSQ